ncbi:MAG: hypothetical protein A3E88_01790 [Legionellales bacterium RIFCSPHIGHO2_12_FULL_35_11]|nr:MAG: hypothetical protein A3E88_01790 [Legionellales bacterium RIFCSPHIGHO2_12_FULL_35_11]
MQNTNIQDVAQQIFFITDLEKILGRNRLIIRRWWLEDKFPKPVKLNGTTLAWRARTIHEWISDSMG